MGGGIIWWLVIGLVAGWLTGKIMGGGGYGAIGDIVLGIVGAFVGGYLLHFIGITGGGMIAEILVATFGACVLVWLVRTIKK